MATRFNLRLAKLSNLSPFLNTFMFSCKQVCLFAYHCLSLAIKGHQQMFDPEIFIVDLH